MPERDIVERLEEWAATTPHKSTLGDMLRAAAAEIERLRADAGWVACSERVPHPGVAVLTALRWWITIGYMDTDGRWAERSGGSYYGANGPPPTHWRPLPPAPERGA